MLPGILLGSDFIGSLKDVVLACINLALVERQTLNKNGIKVRLQIVSHQLKYEKMWETDRNLISLVKMIKEILSGKDLFESGRLAVP